MELIDFTGRVKIVEGKPLMVTTKQPPRMSRGLHSKIFEYRSTPSCLECRQSSLRCKTCGLPLPIVTQQFCREHGVPVEPLYVYEHEHDDGTTQSPICACPICHAIDWWADEGYNFGNKEFYFAGLYRWVEF
jgi:hypothetical protein